MKIFFSLLILLSSFSQAQVSKAIAYDKAGFVTCFQNHGRTYFFAWDQFSEEKNKDVSYFELKDYVHSTSHKISSCLDVNYLTAVPDSILKDPQQITEELSETVLLSIKEVTQGAHLFHFESTAKEYVQNRAHIFKKNAIDVLTNLRYQTGDLFALEVMNYFTDEIAVQNNSCESLIGTCDFYLCQEKENPCGLDGYNLSFGYKYCSESLFKLKQKMSSSQGQAWVDQTIQCLQEKNFENSEMNLNLKSCEMIQSQAFQAHPDCYVKAGYCQLSFVDKFKIFNLLKTEIFNLPILLQGIDLLKLCGLNSVRL